MPEAKDVESQPTALEESIPTIELEVDDVGGASPYRDELEDIMGEQDEEAEQFALEFLKKVLRLRGVKIDREHFLKSELQRRAIPAGQIREAVEANPAYAGISLEMLDGIASNSIEFETNKSTALSFAAGLPGGLAIIGTVPADITQFYVHAFRIMQKLAYLYGWQSFMNDLDEVDDETLGKMAVFLGVMMGVAGASSSLTKFAAQVAAPAVQKKVASIALTKTAWYLPMKQTLRIVGVQVTKQSFANTVSKVVPVVGGVVSGGLTYVTLNNQAKRLAVHLREIPPPLVDAEQYMTVLAATDAAEAAKKTSFALALEEASGTVRTVAASGISKFRSVDLDGDGVADEPVALTKAKGLGRALSGQASRFGRGMKGFTSAWKNGDAPQDGKDSPLEITVRRYESSDAAATLQVFLDAVMVTAAGDYSAEQIAAWADAESRELSTWDQSMAARNSFVAVIGDEVVGFSDIALDGYIDMMFVAPKFARRGVGTALVAVLESVSTASLVRQLSANVSITAVPFFQAHGFEIEEERITTVNGVELQNYRMVRVLSKRGD